VEVWERGVRAAFFICPPSQRHIGADEIYLAIKDDGCGFVPPSCLKQLAARPHFGLVGLRERVQSLNGKFNIMSQVGAGTQVGAYVPIN